MTTLHLHDLNAETVSNLTLGVTHLVKSLYMQHYNLDERFSREEIMKRLNNSQDRCIDGDFNLLVEYGFLKAITRGKNAGTYAVTENLKRVGSWLYITWLIKEYRVTHIGLVYEWVSNGYTGHYKVMFTSQGVDFTRYMDDLVGAKFSASHPSMIIIQDRHEIAYLMQKAFNIEIVTISLTR